MRIHRRGARRVGRALLATSIVIGALVGASAVGGAGSSTVEVPITSGTIEVGGASVPLGIGSGAAARLTGVYDDSTGAFSGRFVASAFTWTASSPLAGSITLRFAPLDAAVSGTIPSAGSGRIGPVVWPVGVEMTGVAGCTVTIGPLELETTFDRSGALPSLTLRVPSFTVPEASCADVGMAGALGSRLGLPATGASATLVAADASALAPTQLTPKFAG